MVSPELIRRYPIFAGLSFEQIVELAKSAQEVSIETGEYLFLEDEVLNDVYLVTDGALAIILQVPDRSVEQNVSDQLTGGLVMKDVSISTVGTGNVFGWSGLVPPYTATAAAKALTDGKVIAFDTTILKELFESDPQFGYIMTQKAAQVIRERLRDLRIETLSTFVD